MTITMQTARDIAYAHREIETAKALLHEIAEALNRRQEPDIQDAFGRHQGGLQLGVPSGSSGHRLFNVPWPLARVVIEAHIAQQSLLISALSEKARAELATPEPANG